jgi:uncharacterized protein YndB with AHSA1/START domain
MAHVKLTEHIEAPIERVFDLFIDVKRWPEFMPGGGEIKEVTGPLDKVGTRICDVTQFMGRKLESWEEIVEVERPRLLKIRSEGGGFKGTATYTLTTVGTGTDLVAESDYEVPAGFLGHVADRLFLEKAMERQMRHAGENMKAFLEAEVPVPV